MDTTPEDFRWALAPDLAAWSSDRDREANPNIRQRRPAMEQDQAQLTLTQETRIQPVASSRSEDDVCRPGAAGTTATTGARTWGPDIFAMDSEKKEDVEMISHRQIYAPNTDEYEAPIRSSVIQRIQLTSGYLSDIDRIAETSDEEPQASSIRGFSSTKRTLADESQSAQPKGRKESVPRRVSVQLDNRHRSPSDKKTKTDKRQGFKEHDPWDWRCPSPVRAKDTQRKRSSSGDRDRRRHHEGGRSRRRDTSPSSDESDDSSPARDMSRHRHKIKVRPFDGTGSFETFWAHFENCASYNRWKEVDKLAHLKAALTGNAGQVLWDTDLSATDTLAKLTALLRSRYSGSRQADKYRMELRLRHRRHGESLSVLHQDIRRLIALAHPTLPQEAREAIACDCFIDALDDPDFALKVRERAPASLDEALRVSLRLEAWAKDAQRKSAKEEPKPRHQVRGAGGNDKESRLEERVDNLNKRFDELMRSTQSQAEIHPPPKSQLPDKDSGFYDSTRPRQKESAPRATWPNRTFSQRPPIVCWNCNQPGHIRRNCDAPPKEPTGATTKVSHGLDRADVYLKMKLYEEEVPCLMDTGCDITLVPKDVVEKVGEAMKPTERRMWAANGTEMKISGEVNLPFILNGQCIETYALVTPDIEEVMIGADWLKEHRCLWDFNKSQLYVDGRPAITLSRKRTLRCRRLYTTQDIVVPAQKELVIPARSTLVSPRLPGTNFIVENGQIQPGIYLGRTLLPPAHHNLQVRVVNTKSEPTTLKSDTWLGNLCPVTVIENDQMSVKPTAEKSKSAKEILLAQLPKDITNDQYRQVSELLECYQDVFSKGSFDMGRTNLVEHKIDTGDHRPIRQGLRRHPRAHLDIIDQQVSELIQNDFVEPAASPWASNVVLVRKKDGSHRLCVDYRAVNSVTYKDTYPLPHIDTCLSSMDGAVWFSTLDLRSGYHNIPIKESDRDKTAFITRRGCFRYKVLPFGLTTAPSVFQRLMDLVLCGLTYMSCLVYLDDIIVFGKDFNTHAVRLKEVFKRLRAANLKLHVNKCCLFQRRVSFLGHVISEAGIEVQEDKISAVRDWPVPRDLSEVRSFLGFCSYYRRFIAGFADIAAPLHWLMRKDVRFHWGPDQDKAFAELKKRLMAAPILGMPTDDGAFIVDSDASNTGLGAVLSQVQNGNEVVLAYASRSLSRAERNYDVTRKELLAIIFALKTFKQYVLGRRFTIRTDHAALQWLKRTPEPMAQLARWLAFIEQFHFDISHRAGARHGNADGLSRIPPRDMIDCCRITDGEPEPDKDKQLSVETDSVGETIADIATAQQADPDISPVLGLRMSSPDQPDITELLQASSEAKRLWSDWHRLELTNGVLYRHRESKDGRPSTLQLIVPASMKQKYLKEAHRGMTGGHLGVRRTLDQVQRRAFWFGWRRDVKRFCRCCTNCCQYFRGQLPRSAPLQPMTTGAPFERIHVDLTGPHPRSRRGNTYIFTCIDPFTKWAEAFAIPNKEAPTVARVLVEQVFCRLGVPISLLTDRGREVDGNLMNEVCRLLEVDKIRTTAYKASTNAAVERFHRTLNSLLGRTIDENQKDWDSLLPYVMAAYRSSRHEATK